MKTIKLAKIIEFWTSFDPDGGLSINDVLSNITAVGQTNQEVNKATERNGSSLRRTKRLDSDTEIKGEFIVVDYEPHRGDLILHNYDSKKAVEEYLLSDQGPFNPFCGFAIPIIDSKPWFYNLSCEINGEFQIFYKHTQFIDPDPFKQKYHGRKIKWIKEAEQSDRANPYYAVTP